MADDRSEREDGVARTLGDTMGELDGAPVRLADVPKARRAEWYTRVGGRMVRPFRYIGTGGDNPFG